MNGPRRGISLVEMMVVLALISTVAGLSAVCLYGMLRAERTAREALTRQTALTRLAQQFRADAHAATGATLERAANGTPHGLAFRGSDDRTTVYRHAGAKIERTVVAGNQRLHHDAFALTASGLEWSLADGFRPLASVVVYVVPPGDSPPAVASRIEAAVGVP